MKVKTGVNPDNFNTPNINPNTGVTITNLNPLGLDPKGGTPNPNATSQFSQVYLSPQDAFLTDFNNRDLQAKAQWWQEIGYIQGAYDFFRQIGSSDAFAQSWIDNNKKFM